MSEPHRYPVRIHWEDTDAAGIVYYANYLRFMERGRSDLVRGAGIDQAALLDHDGVMFPVRRCEIDYLLPARLDDEIEVQTRVKNVGGASMDMDQDIHRNGEALVRAKVRLACVGRNGKPRRLPQEVRAAISEFMRPASGPTTGMD